MLTPLLSYVQFNKVKISFCLLVSLFVHVFVCLCLAVVQVKRTTCVDGRRYLLCASPVNASSDLLTFTTVTSSGHIRVQPADRAEVDGAFSPELRFLRRTSSAHDGRQCGPTTSSLDLRLSRSNIYIPRRGGLSPCLECVPGEPRAQFAEVEFAQK